MQAALLCSMALLAACAGPQVAPDEMSVTLLVDGIESTVQVQPGTTAQGALQAGGIELGPLDRSEPPLFTVLDQGATVTLTRVIEEFTIEEVVMPYETQVLRNESLPDGERRLIQPGENGAREDTYRVVYEGGEQVSSTLVKSVILIEPQAEIVMVGSQSSFSSEAISGKLAYISAGNAWLMEESTGLRRPLVTSGDLDGRIFSLSPDGRWLLFSRSDEREDVINTLWIVSTPEDQDEIEIDLGVQNVVHFAEWRPGSVNGIIFSTVDPSSTAPGWQANNDLLVLNFETTGWVSPSRTILEPSSGGKYGWWGTEYAFSPDGEQLAYARPDAVGLVDFEAEDLQPLLEITPLLTRADWAWVPGLGWSPDGSFLFTVAHAAQEGLAAAEESPLFDLTAVSLVGGPTVPLVEKAGMFAFPRPSILTETLTGEDAYQVVYLQAIVSTQSDTSEYQIVLIDRDGSNRRVLFPGDGAPGLKPQELLWEPNGTRVAFTYGGDLWLLDTATGAAQQLTGDGLVTALDWE
jgi:Tol biopolymer transport system component